MKDMLEAGVLDPYLVKHWGIKLATNAAITVLRVDQVRIKTLYITKKRHQVKYFRGFFKSLYGLLKM